MLARRMLAVLLVAGLLASGDPAATQGDASWQVTGAAPLALPATVGLRIFPAPDGLHYSFESAVRLNGHIDRFACAANSQSENDLLCLLPPEDLPRGFDVEARSPFIPVGWAPDGGRLAFVGQPLLTAEDTDLWIMDLAAGTWANLTEDGYDGALVAAEGIAAPPAGVTIDVQLAWSPDGALIAVERTVTGEGGIYQPSTISVVEVASGAVRDLTTLPGSAAYPFDAGATTGISWAPDGAQLAISVQHAPLDAEADGIWLVSLADGALTQLAGVADIAAAFGAVYADVALATVGPLNWSPDGARLLFWAGDMAANPVSLWAFWITFEGGTITPLPLPAHPNDTGSRRGIWPLQAAWSPDGGALLVLTSGKLPDEDLAPLDPAGRARVSVRLVDVAASTSTLLGGLPSGLSVPFWLAAWGPDNNAILNGYRLTLAGG
jgi:dipeptidyl aminopeptidase/acylaminoacyl peptidase